MEKAQSLGLIGMRERVWGMQGEITVSSDEPPGTRIDIVLPLPHKAPDDSAMSAAGAMPEPKRGSPVPPV